ncbi:hypothetical protein F5888DRAFT_227849 [Russula emetica]|nr:hypothetical protein F5888DRAFT_227849 [Russula emetica]
MSNSTLSPPPPPPGMLQSQTDVLGPGIAGLFIQGLLTGLVLGQFCRWFSAAERKDSAAFSLFVVFVTVVGFAQTGMLFSSSWVKYVKHFGQEVLPDWTDYTQTLPALVIAAPIQALMIWRCYYIVGKNKHILVLLVSFLITSIALSIWSITKSLQFEVTLSAKDNLHMPQSVGISYPYLMSLILPSSTFYHSNDPQFETSHHYLVLDVILSGILLHYLTRTMKHVYAPHMRRRLAYLMTAVWKSAIPPTLCAIFLCMLYAQISAEQQKKPQFWFSTIQGAIGKLYVLSLYYIINDDAPTRELTTAFAPTLTVPIEAYDTFSLDTRVGGGLAACSQSTVAPTATPSMSTNTAV